MTHIEQAKNLPKGTELTPIHRYGLMVAIIERRQRLWFWQREKREIFTQMLKRLAV